MNVPTPPWVRSIAVLGDLHGKFTREDVGYFNNSDVDLVIFVGDLGSGTKKDGLSVIRTLAHLEKRTLVLPGNNDAEHLAALSAEFAFQAGRNALLGAEKQKSAETLQPIGYSCHHINTPVGEISLIAGRPLSQGGGGISFADILNRTHGVDSVDASVAKYRELVSEARSQVLFLAHNGPTGLGDTPESPWGRDFSVLPEDEPRYPRDFGDEDLASAIAFAKESGRRVLGVIAGHMHRGKRSRKPLSTEVDGTKYVNPAWVPRVFAGEGYTIHHHVLIRFDEGSKMTVKEHFVELV